jgi:tRNA dimethylallyltransferase
LPAVAKPVLLLAGPTGSGKTSLAVELARRAGAEVVSVDSVAVYRGLDAGAAKPTPQDRRQVAHHLLDVVEPWETYTLARFLQDARRALAHIREKGRPAILVGGTGMFARALVEGWTLPGGPPDPQRRAALRERLAREGSRALWQELAQLAPHMARRVAPEDGVRVLRGLERVYERGADSGPGVDPRLGILEDVVAVVLDPPRDLLRARIRSRLEGGLMAAVVEETWGLWRRHIPPHASAFRAVGYRQALAYLMGRITYEEMVRLTLHASWDLAKRQRTWWRPVPWVIHVPAQRSEDALTAVWDLWRRGAALGG